MPARPRGRSPTFRCIRESTTCWSSHSMPTGQEVDRTYIDIWRDTGTTHDVAGTISTDTTWSAEAGPYRVTGECDCCRGRDADHRARNVGLL